MSLSVGISVVLKDSVCEAPDKDWSKEGRLSLLLPLRYGSSPLLLAKADYLTSLHLPQQLFLSPHPSRSPTKASIPDEPHCLPSVNHPKQTVLRKATPPGCFYLRLLTSDFSWALRKLMTPILAHFSTPRFTLSADALAPGLMEKAGFI